MTKMTHHAYLDEPPAPAAPEPQLCLWEEPTLADVIAADEVPLIGGPFGDGVAAVPYLDRYRVGQRILIDKRLPVDPARPGAAVCHREAYEVVGEGEERRLVWAGA